MTTAAHEVIPHRVIQGPQPKVVQEKKPRRKKVSRWQRYAPVLRSAYFWYVALAVSGAATLPVGVGIEYGLGHGLMTFGLMSVLGSEVIRGGMTRRG